MRRDSGTKEKLRKPQNLMEERPRRPNILFQHLMENGIYLAFGKDLLEQAREQLKQRAKRRLFTMFKFRAGEITSSTRFNLH